MQRFNVREKFLLGCKVERLFAEDKFFFFFDESLVGIISLSVNIHVDRRLGVSEW